MKSIMDAVDGEMSFIPLGSYLDRFHPFGFTDYFTTEHSELIERLKNDIIRFANMEHYTIKDSNGFYLKDNEFSK